MKRKHTTDDHAELQKLAYAIAEEMNRDHFDSHRGVEPLDVAPIEGIYIYDNHPYADKERRPREHAAMHSYLESVGADLVASASYPPDGDQPGYTVVHIYECDDADAAIAEYHKRDAEILVGAIRGIN